MKYLSVRVPKSNEFTYEQAFAFFSSLAMTGTQKSFFDYFKKSDSKSFSFNILSVKQRISFIIVATDEDAPSLSNLIQAQYPSAEVQETPPFQFKTNYIYELVPSKSSFFPLKTIDGFRDVDPMASLLSSISRTQDPNAVFWLQIIVKPTSSSWQQQALGMMDSLSRVEKGSFQSQSNRNQVTQIQEKIKHPGFKVSMRILSNTRVNLNLFYSSFSILTGASGNALMAKEPGFLSREKVLKKANTHAAGKDSMILNAMELATLWHLPNKYTNIPNIVWGKKLSLEAPHNLPVVEPNMTPEQKSELTLFGKTFFKNTDQIFGIKRADRLKHIYIVGKTGTGKSTLLENMIVDDIRKGYGVAFMDPHGESAKKILEYIPKNRINDVCYFNPADPDFSFPLNILELPNASQRELMVSGIISIFHKLYGNSWGPRLEYILRNVLFTLSNVEGTTLADVLTILLDKGYRSKVVGQLKDPVLVQFWTKEFERMDPKLQTEAISPILNKVGQFVTSPLIRKIINNKHSKVKIDKIMNNGKILICNLSQGLIGEDNSTLLGSMIITLIQIHTLNRAAIRAEERLPFYLYVDEFQNFATPSFIKILSEARKYGLALTIANQYMDQIDPTIINAILGNVGTLLTLAVGNKDSYTLSKEFGQTLLPEDLTSLERFQMVMRLSIDLETSAPFPAYSLPPPKNVSGHYDKIIEASRRNFGKPVQKIQ